MNAHRRLILLLGLLVASMMISIALGDQSFTPKRLVSILLGGGDETQRMILLSFRLPRVFMTVLVGMALAVSGVLMQCVLRNDLVEPGIMGVASGGNLGITLAVIFGGSQIDSPWTMPAMSMICAMMTVLIVCLLAYDGSAMLPTRLLLTGVAVSTGIGAFTLVLSLHIDRQAYAQALAWLAGSFSKSDWNYVTVLACWLLGTIPFTLAVHNILDVLRLREEVSRSLGLPVDRWRIILLLFGVMLGASAMSAVGSMAFVGLVAPHIGRRLVGHSHRYLIVAASIVGAISTLLADTIGRIAFLPIEMPAGVIVSVLGGIYFLYLLVTARS